MEKTTIIVKILYFNVDQSKNDECYFNDIIAYIVLPFLDVIITDNFIFDYHLYLNFSTFMIITQGSMIVFNNAKDETQ